MSKVNYKWSSGTPPEPDVYTTRRNESKYLTLRYWDGETWFEINFTGGRGGLPFEWPKKSRTKKPHWVVQGGYQTCLRKISKELSNIQWGTAYKVYEKPEVLKWLIAAGKLPADWDTCFQDEMRSQNFK